MIPLSDAAMSVLTRSYRMHLAVESWLGDRLLADAVPVDSGEEETDRTVAVPERVTLTVPRLVRGESWSPLDVDHPLAANGQRIRVQLGVELVGGEIEWFQRGWFLIESSVVQGDSVEVEAVGLLGLVKEADLISPYQPTGTFASTVRGLVEPALTVAIDPALVDRAVPAGLNFDDDRLGALHHVLDAWPADAYVHPDGYLAVGPPVTSTTPVLHLTDTAGGTVLQASGGSTREGAASVVVARGTASDGGQVQGLAFDYASPQRIDGEFNPLPVPYFFDSPLLTTVGQCTAAAATILARRLRETAVEDSAEIVPHPALQVGDVVDLSTEDRPDRVRSIEALTLPYLGDGPHSLTLRGLS